MVIRYVLAVTATLMLIGASCDYGYQDGQREPERSRGLFVWQVPSGFPIPVVPADNPMTWEKVALGQQLFYDTRLSGDGTIACASCHRPEWAFTDGRARAKGIRGHIHPRSAMTLTNVAYNATIGWDDPTLTRLEEQIPIPMFNTQPPEMGADGREEIILARLKKDRCMRRLFREAFPQAPSPVTLQNVIYAIASFERTLISGNSPYDRWAYGADPDALDKDQRTGARLFFSKRLSCFRCHAGFNLSGPVRHRGEESTAPRFHNTALYNIDGSGTYPTPNTGVHRITGKRSDMGKFRAPTLRNIALTAPYMHDGSIATLEKVLDHYAAGGRSAPSLAGDPKIDPLMTDFTLTVDEKRQLIAFLHALTDNAFIQQALAQVPRKPKR